MFLRFRFRNCSHTSSGIGVLRARLKTKRYTFEYHALAILNDSPGIQIWFLNWDWKRDFKWADPSPSSRSFFPKISNNQTVGVWIAMRVRRGSRGWEEGRRAALEHKIYLNARATPLRSNRATHCCCKRSDRRRTDEYSRQSSPFVASRHRSYALRLSQIANRFGSITFARDRHRRPSRDYSGLMATLPE